MSSQQPYDYYNQSVSAPMPVADKNGGLAIAGLVLGILGLIAWLLPIVGYPVAIVGIILSAFGRRSYLRKGMATAGLILSIIALILTVISSIIGVYIATHA